MAAVSDLWRSLRFALRSLRPTRREDLVRVAACVLLGGTAGWLLVPAHVGGDDADNGAAPIVLLETRPLVVEPGAVATAPTLDAAAAIGREWLAQKVTVSVPGIAKRELSREELGARVDGERLAALLSQLGDPRSALRRAHAETSRAKAAPGACCGGAPASARSPPPPRCDWDLRGSKVGSRCGC